MAMVMMMKTTCSHASQSRQRKYLYKLTGNIHMCVCECTKTKYRPTNQQKEEKKTLYKKINMIWRMVGWTADRHGQLQTQYLPIWTCKVKTACQRHQYLNDRATNVCVFLKLYIQQIPTTTRKSTIKQH